MLHVSIFFDAGLNVVLCTVVFLAANRSVVYKAPIPAFLVYKYVVE